MRKRGLSAIRWHVAPNLFKKHSRANFSIHFSGVSLRIKFYHFWSINYLPNWCYYICIMKHVSRKLPRHNVFKQTHTWLGEKSLGKMALCKMAYRRSFTRPVHQLPGSYIRYPPVITVLYIDVLYCSGVARGERGNVPPETPENFQRIENSSRLSQQ